MFHLIIEQGANQGEEINIPADGVRFGKADLNSLRIEGSSVSPIHGRFFFKSDESLWVTDFGNQKPSLVNGEPITERRLKRGDEVLVGNVTFRVVQDTLKAPLTEDVFPDENEELDLGFKTDEEKTSSPIAWLLVVLTATAIVVLGGWMLFGIIQSRSQKRSSTTHAQEGFGFDYEKVDAIKSNIYRYAMTLRAGELSAQIDDLANDIHVSKTIQVDSSLLTSLSRIVVDSHFFDLQSEYSGVNPDKYHLRRLSTTIGRRNHRVKILNRAAPPAFAEVSTKLEEFCNNELGLTALAYSPEKLKDLANEAFIQGRKLYAEQDTDYANLARAIRKMEEVGWYLETIQPKPEYYETAEEILSKSCTLLDERYNEKQFQVERNIKFREWSDAARNLRVIIEMIPARSDKRNKWAKEKLLDVERRLK